MPAKKKKAHIDAYTHPADTRLNIPTAEVESVMGADKKRPITLEYERGVRNTPTWTRNWSGEARTNRTRATWR